MSACRKSQEIDLAVYLEDPSLPEFTSFRAHSETCPDCSAEVVSMQALRGAFAAEGDGEERFESDHPAPEFLLAFVDRADSLADDVRNGIARHVAVCAACQDETAVLVGTDLSAPPAVSGAGSEPSLTGLLGGLVSSIGRVIWHPAFAYGLVVVLLIPLAREWRGTGHFVAERTEVEDVAILDDRSVDSRSRLSRSGDGRIVPEQPVFEAEEADAVAPPTAGARGVQVAPSIAAPKEERQRNGGTPVAAGNATVGGADVIPKASPPIEERSVPRAVQAGRKAKMASASRERTDDAVAAVEEYTSPLGQEASREVVAVAPNVAVAESGSAPSPHSGVAGRDESVVDYEPGETSTVELAGPGPAFVVRVAGALLEDVDPSILATGASLRVVSASGLDASHAPNARAKGLSAALSAPMQQPAVEVFDAWAGMKTSMGNPLEFEVPVSKLAPGSYRVELMAGDPPKPLAGPFELRVTPGDRP